MCFIRTLFFKLPLMVCIGKRKFCSLLRILNRSNFFASSPIIWVCACMHACVHACVRACVCVKDGHGALDTRFTILYSHHKQDKTLPTVRRQDYILMLLAPKASVKQSRKATSHIPLKTQPHGSAHCLLSHSPPKSRCRLADQTAVTSTVTD